MRAERDRPFRGHAQSGRRWRRRRQTAWRDNARYGSEDRRAGIPLYSIHALYWRKEVVKVL